MRAGEGEERRSQPISLAASVLLVVCCGIWGVNQVAIKVANEAIPPVLQATIRSLLASLLLIGLMLWRGQTIWRRDGTLIWGLSAATLFGLEFVALYIGLERTTASRGVVLLYCQPIAVAVGVHFFAKGDRLSRVKALGLAAAFLGVCLAMVGRGAGAGQGSLEGDVLCFLGGLAWAGTVILVKAGPLAREPAERVLLYQLAGSLPVLALFTFIRGERLHAWPEPMPLLAFAFTVVVVSFASYLAYFWLLSRYQASRVTAFTFLVPVFGVAAGALLLNEPLSGTLMVALALVAAGIFLVNRPG